MHFVQSNRLLGLVQSATKVETDIATHTEEIGARLDEDFAPIVEGWGEGEEKPNHRAQLRALKDKLAVSREQVSQAEERLIDLIKHGVELRSRRDELAAVLYDDFSSLRRTVEELFRAKGNGRSSVFVIAGIQGPTSQVPAKLVRQVELAVKHLRQPSLGFPASRFGGTPLEPANLADVLEPTVEQIGSVQADLRRLAGEMNASRKEKNRIVAAHKTTFSRVARTAEALFHLAGEQELAERLRPSGRRPGRRVVDVQEGGQEEPEAEASPNGDTPAEGTSGTEGEGASSEGTAPEPAGSPEPATPPTDEPASPPAPPSES